jgi:hypothetical protein
MREQIVHEQVLKSMNVGHQSVANYLETQRQRTSLGNMIWKYKSLIFVHLNPNQRQRRKLWRNNPKLRRK